MAQYAGTVGVQLRLRALLVDLEAAHREVDGLVGEVAEMGDEALDAGLGAPARRWRREIEELLGFVRDFAEWGF